MAAGITARAACSDDAALRVLHGMALSVSVLRAYHLIVVSRHNQYQWRVISSR